MPDVLLHHYMDDILISAETMVQVEETVQAVCQAVTSVGLTIASEKVTKATEGEGGSSQLAELKAVQLALDIAEREKWPKLYLYTDSWMVANALWGWLKKWKKAIWQHRGKTIWAAEEWKNIATQVEKLPVKVSHVDAHVPKSRANEEHQNNEQDKCGENPIEVKNAVNPVVWASDIPGRSKRAEPVSIALKSGATL
ncbi:hypothetical protein HGM15179_018750, partial [Zosterops borbonicus]